MSLSMPEILLSFWFIIGNSLSCPFAHQATRMCPIQAGPVGVLGSKLNYVCHQVVLTCHAMAPNGDVHDLLL